MNMITVLIVALVLGAYYYPSAPKMLKDNKQMLLGVFVGLLMGQYLGVKIEGLIEEIKIPELTTNQEKRQTVFGPVWGGNRN